MSSDVEKKKRDRSNRKNLIGGIDRRSNTRCDYCHRPKKGGVGVPFCCKKRLMNLTKEGWSEPMEVTPAKRIGPNFGSDEFVVIAEIKAKVEPGC